MRNLLKLGALSALIALPLSTTACSDDTDEPGGTGGAAATGGATGTGGSSATGGSATTGGASSTGGSSATGGMGGTASAAPFTTADCLEADGPAAAVTGSGRGAFTDSADWMAGFTHFATDGTGSGENAPEAEETIPNPTGTLTLTADKTWILDDVTYVQDGDTLTIEPGTVIKAESDGSLVVSRGGKIMANGTKEAPIVFTSIAEPGSKNRGDWGGVILLGKAPNFKGQDTLIEGLADNEQNYYGGDDADDSSGELSYVRIEYSGTELSPGNEINGLTLGSVGSGTKLHHVMVNTTLDDCFEWFGGNFDASHLVANNCGDDMFDVDQGFQGKLSNLFGRVGVALSSDPNGFEMDSDLAERTPITSVTAKHVTLCGKGEAADAISFGMVLRENLLGDFDNILVTGFDAAVDARDAFGTSSDPSVTLSNAVFWSNGFGAMDSTIAYVEDATCAEQEGELDYSDPTCNDDQGFDERAWFAEGSGSISP